MKVPVHDKKGRLNKIIEKITALGFEYKLEPNDLKNPEMISLVVEFIDKHIVPPKGLEQKTLVEWANAAVSGTEEPITDVQQLFNNGKSV